MVCQVVAQITDLCIPPLNSIQQLLIWDSARSYLCTVPLKGLISYTRALAWRSSGDPRLRRNYCGSLGHDQSSWIYLQVVWSPSDHRDFDWSCVWNFYGQFVIYRTASSDGRDTFFLLNKKQNRRKKGRGNKIWEAMRQICWQNLKVLWTT